MSNNTATKPADSMFCVWAQEGDGRAELVDGSSDHAEARKLAAEVRRAYGCTFHVWIEAPKSAG